MTLCFPLDIKFIIVLMDTVRLAVLPLILLFVVGVTSLTLVVLLLLCHG